MNFRPLVFTKTSGAYEIKKDSRTSYGQDTVFERAVFKLSKGTVLHLRLIFQTLIFLFILTEITDPRLFLAQSLGKLSVGTPGRLLPIIGSLGEAEQSHLTTYLSAANVQIS